MSFDDFVDAVESQDPGKVFNFCITVKTKDIPEIAAFHKAQAKTRHGFLYKLLRPREYKRLLEAAEIAGFAAQTAFLNAVLDEGKKLLEDTDEIP